MTRPNKRQDKPSYLATTKGGKRIMIRHKHDCEHRQSRAEPFRQKALAV